jgi:orotate phosphoribosyltransferase-like protein
MLFEEWAEQVEKEILNSLNPNQFNAEKISKELKVSEETVLYFLSRLIRDKKIKVLKLELL